VTEVSRGGSTFAVEKGRAEHEGGQALSSSREDQGKQNTLDKRTTGQTKEVKLPGAEQRAEVTRARDKEQASTELWEIIFERENLLTALKRVERNGGAPGIDGMPVEELRP
jgi:RNA-directed DNA polymerase